ncbi:MAG: NAD(P)-dependent oxidoreductase [Kiloniellales bacterium]
MKRFRVGLSGDFFRDDGSACFPEFDLAPLQDREELELIVLDSQPSITAEQTADLDALILLLPRVTAESFHAKGRLSLIARFGVGYDNVDVAACTAHEVALVITPEGVRRPVAVSILTLMLALTGKLFVKDALARRGPTGWAEKTKHNGVGLVGRTLGSLGVGNIGAELFRLAAPLDMCFIAHDPYCDPALARALGVELVGLENLFRRADVLSINCPLNDATRHIVNAERLALMKPSAYLINTARGPIVDQAALTEALAAGRLAGAGLDVFEREPAAADDPLFKLDNVIVAPHALCWTDQVFAGNGACDVRAALAVMQGTLPEGIVNREIGDSAAWRAKLAAYRQRYGQA